MKQLDAPVEEILQDLSELCKGVQHPLRGLFLRHYLSWVSSPAVSIHDKNSVVVAFNFHVSNLLESIKLWGRISYGIPSSDTAGIASAKVENAKMGQLVASELGKILHLEGVDSTMFKTQVLPQVLDCIFDGVKDPINQRFLLDSLTNSITPESLFECYDVLLETARSRCATGVSFPLDCVVERLVGYVLERQGRALRQEAPSPSSNNAGGLKFEELEKVRIVLYESVKNAVAETFTPSTSNHQQNTSKSSQPNLDIPTVEKWLDERMRQIVAYAIFCAVIFTTEAHKQMCAIHLAISVVKLRLPDLLSQVAVDAQQNPQTDLYDLMSYSAAASLRDHLSTLSSIIINGPRAQVCSDMLLREEGLTEPICSAFDDRVSSEGGGYCETIDVLKSLIIDALGGLKNVRGGVIFEIMKSFVEGKKVFVFGNPAVGGNILRGWTNALVRWGAMEGDVAGLICQMVHLFAMDGERLKILTMNNGNLGEAVPQHIDEHGNAFNVDAVAENADFFLTCLDEVCVSVSVNEEVAKVVIPAIIQRVLDAIPSLLKASNTFNAAASTPFFFIKKGLQNVNKRVASLTAMGDIKLAMNSIISAILAVSALIHNLISSKTYREESEFPSLKSMTERMVAEFLTQTLVLVEDVRTDSRAHLSALLSIITCLHDFRTRSCLSAPVYKDFSKLLVQHCLKLSKKSDQCVALMASSHLYWPTPAEAVLEGEEDVSAKKDGDAVVAVLNKAVEVCDGIMASGIGGTLPPCACIYVDILDKFVLHFEEGCETVTLSFIVQFTTLCIETIQVSLSEASGVTSSVEQEVKEATKKGMKHLASIVRYMKTRRNDSQGPFTSSTGGEALDTIDLGALIALYN
eukprot:GDKJ01015738.1.p1 GENE.GDKJ01015738.1~~GDKJ01015738.1.p1  ORF type:complete len:985 (-),score=212.68 GDKJ01015738.1:104-2683(-)